jgi:hypothetical protein
MSETSAQKSVIYAIGIGGSGAKCIESLAYLSAIGMLGNSDLNVLLVDADSTNGNSQDTIRCLTRCEKVHDIVRQGISKFMQGDYKSCSSWNPLAVGANNKSLEEIFLVSSMRSEDPSLGDLFDALYSPEERSAKLNVGFRGRPPIGSAVFSRLNFKYTEKAEEVVDDTFIWPKYLSSILSDVSGKKDITIHLFGSLFGGTGAAGVPTIARKIDEYLRGDNGKLTDYRNKIRLNASLLLPYFEFDKPQDSKSSVFAEVKDFPINTQAALQFLAMHSQQTFNGVYLVGNRDNTRYNASTGNNKQHNEANIVEVYAALAVAHGIEIKLDENDKKKDKKFEVSYISRKSEDRFRWEDLPNGVRGASPEQHFATAIRFAFAWKHNFALELEQALNDPSGFTRGAPWFGRFFKSPMRYTKENLPSIKDEYHHVKTISDWCDFFLEWAHEIGNTTALDPSNRLFIHADKEPKRDYFNDMAPIVIDKISKSEKSSLNLDEIKCKLADQKHPDGELGIALLVHSLFRQIYSL